MARSRPRSHRQRATAYVPAHDSDPIKDFEAHLVSSQNAAPVVDELARAGADRVLLDAAVKQLATAAVSQLRQAPLHGAAPNPKNLNRRVEDFTPRVEYQMVQSAAAARHAYPWPRRGRPSHDVAWAILSDLSDYLANLGIPASASKRDRWLARLVGAIWPSLFDLANAVTDLRPASPNDPSRPNPPRKPPDVRLGAAQVRIGIRTYRRRRRRR